MAQWIISSSILILVVMALRWLLKGRITLRLQYALWALVLVRLLVPLSFSTSQISVQNITVQVAKTPAVQAVARMEIPRQSYDDAYEQVVREYTQQGTDVHSLPPVRLEQEAQERMHLSLGQILTGLWLLGAAVCFGFLLVSNLHFRWQLRRDRRPLDIPWISLPVYTSDSVPTPCMFGILRPAIYLPPDAAEDQTGLRHILEHELTHYFHADHVFAPLRCLALTLHWYNPLVWWAARVSRQDGELACDESTIARLGEEERLSYGRTLIRLTCERVRPADLMLAATTMSDDKKSIKERITMIAKKPKMAVYTLIAVILIGAIAVGCTFTGPVGSGDETQESTTETTEDAEQTEPMETTEVTEPIQTQEADPLDAALLALGYTQSELISTAELESQPDWGKILLEAEIGNNITDEQLEDVFSDIHLQMEQIPTDKVGAVITELSLQRMSGIWPFAVYDMEYDIITDQDRAIRRKESVMFHYDDRENGNWTYIDAMTQAELNEFKTSDLGDSVAKVSKAEAVARYLWNRDNPEAIVELEWVSAQSLPQVPKKWEILASLPTEYDEWYGDYRLQKIDYSLWNDLLENFSERQSVGIVITDLEQVYANEDLQLYCYAMETYYVFDEEDALRYMYYVACHYDASYPTENQWSVAIRNKYEMGLFDIPELVEQYGSREAAFANQILD